MRDPTPNFKMMKTVRDQKKTILWLYFVQLFRVQVCLSLNTMGHWVFHRFLHVPDINLFFFWFEISYGGYVYLPQETKANSNGNTSDNTLNKDRTMGKRSPDENVRI